MIIIDATILNYQMHFTAPDMSTKDNINMSESVACYTIWLMASMNASTEAVIISVEAEKP